MGRRIRGADYRLVGITGRRRRGACCGPLGLRIRLIGIRLVASLGRLQAESPGGTRRGCAPSAGIACRQQAERT